MNELNNLNLQEVNGGSRAATALRFIGMGARFGGPIGVAIGIGIEVYLHVR